jgi:hypothetical protein
MKFFIRLIYLMITKNTGTKVMLIIFSHLRSLPLRV